MDVEDAPRVGRWAALTIFDAGHFPNRRKPVQLWLMGTGLRTLKVDVGEHT